MRAYRRAADGFIKAAFKGQISATAASAGVNACRGAAEMMLAEHTLKDIEGGDREPEHPEGADGNARLGQLRPYIKKVIKTKNGTDRHGNRIDSIEVIKEGTETSAEDAYILSDIPDESW